MKQQTGSEARQRNVRKQGLAICKKCGDELIAPADGQPYWCIECSQED